MTETKQKSATAPAPAPAPSGFSTEERVYATRYKQGKRTAFSLALSPDQIINLIARPDPEANNPGNRKIRPKHASDFSKYYLDNEKWVSPGLILRAPSIFTFEADLDAPGNKVSFGALSYPKRSQRDIQILDGQHRILGFHIAADEITRRIEKGKDFRARALRTEGGDKNSAAVREAQKMIDDAEKLRDRFFSEAIALEIQVTDDITEYLQIFYDIAENAIGITSAVKARFDTRKVANRALPLVMEHPLLKERVDINNDRIGTKSPYLLSAKHVSEIIRSAEVGVDGRIGKIMERTLSDVSLANTANAFLDTAVESFAPYRALLAGQAMPDQLRTGGLLGSPATLRMLASVYRELKQRHGFSSDQITAYFKTLEPHLLERAHAHSIWIEHMPDGAFNVDSYSPDVRRQNIAAAVDAIVDWAVLGKKGAPFVWAKPKPAPPRELTQDELDLAADKAADDKLEGLIAQREELETKMAKKGQIKK